MTPAEDNKAPPVQAHRWQPSIMVWGTTTYEKTSIIGIFDGTTKATDYVAPLKRRLLKDLPMLHLKRSQSNPQNQLVFQQDGAKIHGAFITNNHFKERGIKVLYWPPWSPDLNLVEAVWSEVKRKLKRSHDSKEELEEDIQKQWKNISSEYPSSLYDSMRDRIQAVIVEEGGPTDY